MQVQFTDEQSRAITTRDASVALSAGAGCGKTFVLTERFLSHIDPKRVAGQTASGIGQLVAITFTEAAAREMRGRIRQKCHERMSHARGDEARAWWTLARRLDAARIHTIHGFCRTLLAEHAVEAGLDPQFRVLDEGQAGLLRLRVIDDFLRRKLAAWEADLFRLIRNGRIESLREDLLELLSQSSSPAFARWLNRSPEELCQAWEEAARRKIPAAVGRNVALCTAGMQVSALVAKLHGTADGPLKEKCLELTRLLETLEKGRGTQKLLGELRSAAIFQGVAKKALWAGAHAALRDPFKDTLAKLRDKIDKYLKQRPFDAETAISAAGEGLGLLKLAAEARDEYTRQKAERAVLDFDDLIHRAVVLLTDRKHAHVLKQARAGIFALLVDEFQDTDRQQLELVRALCGDGLASGKLFFVGDRKQSIYRFRGAEPRVFQELAAALPEGGRLALTENFRSQPAVLDFVNALFLHEFGPDYEPLVPHRKQVSPKPAVEFLWTPPGEAAHGQAGARHDKLKVADVRRGEAAAIARRLRELIDSEEPLVWDAEAAAAGTPQARRLRMGDIAILFRALSDVHLYESALRAEELEYYLVGGHAFYAQQEIRDFVHLLRAVASEADEVALAGALRSPLFALHDETLFWLVHSGGTRRTLNEGLQAPPPLELDEDERRKVTRAAETFRHLRELKDRDTISAVVSAAIERLGYDAILLGEFLGERKLANLNKLLDDARAADAAGNNLDAFVTQLSHFVSKLPKEPLAATTSETADVIRLMTIHQSKGLEFPLVVLPDLNRQSTLGREAVALHEELGPLVQPRAAQPGGTPPIAGLDLYKELEEDEERQEALRVLYVGCTRAADYLILSSGFEKPELSPKGMLNRVARNFDLETGRCTRDLPEDFDEPEVRVTVHPLKDAPQRGGSGGSRLAQLLEKVPPPGKTPRQVPPDVLPLVCDMRPREFSFSRLSGVLERLERDSRECDEIEGPARDISEVPSHDAAREEALAVGQLVHAALEALQSPDAADGRSVVARYAETVLPASCRETRERIVERAETYVGRALGAARFREVSRAKQAAREVDFLLPWPPRGEGSKREDRPYLIRGVIDCLYQDADGGWHVLDYKTNRIPRGKVASVARPYELQLQVYAIALEEALRITPQELVLWFLDADEQFVVPWNDSLRTECIGRVSAAIERLVSGV